MTELLRVSVSGMKKGKLVGYTNYVSAGVDAIDWKQDFLEHLRDVHDYNDFKKVIYTIQSGTWNEELDEFIPDGTNPQTHL
jgi:hypothetical protein